MFKPETTYGIMIGLIYSDAWRRTKRLREFLALGLFFIGGASQAGIPTTEPIYVNCGGSSPLVDRLGRTWQPDETFLAPGHPGTGVSTSARSVDTFQLCDLMIPEQVMRVERYRDGDLHYSLSLPSGSYRVVLYFAETDPGAVNSNLGGSGCQDCSRAFDVDVEGEWVGPVDPADAAFPPNQDGAGAVFTGTELSVDASLRDGFLDIRVIDLGDENLTDHPAIKAFVVRPVGDTQELEETLAVVEERLLGTERYRMREVSLDEREYMAERDVDLLARAVHSIVRVGVDPTREIELYWIDDRAYGAPSHIGHWFNMWVPADPPSRLHALASGLKARDIQSVWEEQLDAEPCWVLSVVPDMSEHGVNALPAVEAMFGRLRDGNEENLRQFEQIARIAAVVQLRLQFWVARDTYEIRQVIMKTLALGTESAHLYRFSNRNDPQIQVSPPNDALEAEGPAFPFSALFLDYSHSH